MLYDADGNPVLADDDMDWGGEQAPVDKERAVTVIAENRRIEFEELGISPRKAVKAAQALGWEVRAWLSETRVAAVLYVGSNDNHSAGDVRYPEFTARNYAVEARHPDQPLGFRAHYTGTSRDSSPRSAKFEHAWVADPVGIPVENYFDYSPGARREALESGAKA